MPEYNLLKQYPKALRNLKKRSEKKKINKVIAKKYGREYFDGTREQGYGGYTYDGRWVSIAKDIIKRYHVKSGDKILDIGCAKGFLIKDLVDQCSGLEVCGLDISEYALLNSHPDISNNVVRGNADKLPFPDNTFKFVSCINVLHNLNLARCKNALREINRVLINNSYVQVDAYRSEDEKQMFIDWVLTAETYGTPEFWRQIFIEANYEGDFYWTIIVSDPEWTIEK